MGDSFGDSSIENVIKLSAYDRVFIEKENGKLIDNGKWFLRENYLWRVLSDNFGMYGNVDIILVDILIDKNSIEVLYLYFGELVFGLIMVELFFLEIEEMI